MYKVLLVDDEILIREAIGAKIPWNRLGFELVGECENGRDAIEVLKSTPVDLVLTDICMPYTDGMELSKYIHEHLPRTVIVIFSGYMEFQYAKQAIQYKVAEYILKPVTARELSEVLDRIREKLDGERQKVQKMDELTKIYSSYTKNESLIVSRALSHLVRGSQDIGRSLAELTDLGVQIGAGIGLVYRVAAVDIDVYSDLFEAVGELKKESALMSFVVENISHEIVSSHKAGIAYRDLDNRICILFFENRKIESAVQDICGEIKHTIYEVMRLSVSIGIGKCVCTLENLSKSYESAADILKYRYTKGGGVILDCEQTVSSADPLELGQDFRNIAQALTEYNKAALRGALENVECWLKLGYVSRNRAVTYLHQILQIVYDTVRETDEEFTLEDSVISSITDARSLEKAMKLIWEYSVKGVEAICAAGQSSGQRQAALALEYIRENYSNCDISLNLLCSHLNISTSRFSSIFKEATGRTFTEVLTNIRMERAKWLLKKTSLRNYEIADKVGFSDPHYFSVAFKKATGKTPKEYAREYSI